MNDGRDNIRGSQSTGVRLQKVLAQAGVGSRRACEELIAAGRVAVDGRVVRELGTRVDPATAVLHVDGLRITAHTDLVVLAFHKPEGVVTTMLDPEGRPCVGDYLRDRSERVYPVGRLDADTRGLHLLTNDGTLAHRIAHPSFELPKTYLAEIAGPLPRTLGRTLRAGVDLEDGPVALDSFRVVSKAGSQALVEVVLHEGRNRVIRRMFDAVGHPVSSLVRTEVGPVALGSLRPGKMRPLRSTESGALYAAVGL